MVSVLGLVLVDTSLAAESIGSAPSTNTDTGENKSYKVISFFKFAFPGKFLQTNRNVRDLPLPPFDKLAYLQLIFCQYCKLIFSNIFSNIFSLIFLQLIFFAIP